MVLDRPVLDLVPCGIERRAVIKQPHPQGGKRADAVPRPPVGTPHLQKALQPHFGKGGRQMVDPVALARLFAGKRRKIALQEIPRSEEHTSELQSLMRISYAVFRLKKKTNYP